jgi:hypothetical protein
MPPEHKVTATVCAEEFGKMRLELVRQGFTQEQAFLIVLESIRSGRWIV